MREARLYLVTPARVGSGAVADLVPELVEAGVDVIQLREKEMEARDILRAGRPLADACRAAGIPFLVNDRVDLALALGADGCHVGQEDLPVEVVRAILPSAIVGTSTHSPAQVDAAAAAGDIDYFAVGPVFETPTKKGRPAAGLELIRHAAARKPPTPWFAIGGINESTLAQVIDAGGRRIVVVRAITESASPPEAAARLRARLDAVAL